MARTLQIPTTTILIPQTKMKVMTKIEYLTEDLPYMKHVVVWRKPGLDLENDKV
jgi:hypothetical protein